MATSSRRTQVLILGGGVGGCAAALACARMGARCVVVEPTTMVGGQLTAQGVPPDENRWVEEFGGTATYRELRRRVRAHYQSHPDLRPELASLERFNPGGGWVSRLCAEPIVWHAALRGMLSAAPGVDVLLEHDLVSASTAADAVASVRVRDRATGVETDFNADLVLDATETGDLWALAGVEHAIGAEHQAVYGELHGRTDFDPARALDPLDQQACSWCFALEHRPGEDHVGEEPADYGWWRSYVPATTPVWTGPLFSWLVPSHNPEGRRTFRMVPWPDEPEGGEWEMWRYRRIMDRAIWREDAREAHPDVTVINMVQMDYWLRPLLGVGPAAVQAALDGARSLSRCWLHWMRTEAPRHDGGHGYPGLALRGGELGTADGFAASVYIREPRRLLARTMLTEAHVGTDQRRADGRDTAASNWDATPFGTAERFADSVAVGHYMIDLHPSCSGRNNVYVPAAPYQIPLGALVPLRVRNALAAGKGLGVSHIVNGATRMHAGEWSVGEAAGVLAGYCLRAGVGPHAVAEDRARVAEVRSAIVAGGAAVEWPWDR